MAWPRSWQHASPSPIPTIRPRRSSITDLPTPYGRGWRPSKSGAVQRPSCEEPRSFTAGRNRIPFVVAARRAGILG